MAEAVLLAIVEGIIANVGAEVIKQIRLPKDVQNEIHKLEDDMTTIKAVLLDADDQENQRINNQVKVLLDKLEDVIYDADNLLDKFRYQQLRRRVDSGKITQKVWGPLSNILVSSRNMAKKIKQIRETLGEIKAKRGFHLDERPQDARVPPITSGRETHSFESEDLVIGREGDKKEIIDGLKDDSFGTEENVSVISLVGIGGLGKTTLAKIVINDDLVKSHFEEQIYWVSVSDSFDLRSVLEKIILSRTETSLGNLILEQLQKMVRKEIQGKKYLLVLDDVWNEDVGKWEELKSLLNVGAKGSRILITTRSQNVANIVKSTKIHGLSGLNPTKSRDLFERVAFGRNCYERTVYPHLVEIGKKIVEKCKGVPLAIKTIGRVLLLLTDQYSSNELVMEWERFRDNILVRGAYNQSDRDQNDLFSALKLSYNKLPTYLKNCFAYCSLFPKNHKIDVQQLIQLWIAQGFVKPETDRNLEQTGYKCFMSLFSLYFFEEPNMDELSPRSIRSCKMHDLIHELARLVAGKSIKIVESAAELETTNTWIEIGAENLFEKVRHIYVNFKSNSSFQISTSLFNKEKMRTFILPQSNSSKYDDILSKFKYLRALSLRIPTNEETLPIRLSKLKLLRYLDLSENYSIKKLPNSITRLYYLQTLILMNCASLVSLPADIQKLINLRHLEIKGCTNLTHMPRGIGELTSLQTLDMFVVADNTSEESGGFDELSKLKNLHGSLTIHIRGLTSGDAPCLEDKKHLESLVLSWKGDETRGSLAQEAFARLRPPHYINAIKVESYPDETFPTNWFSSLTYVLRLELSGCSKLASLPDGISDLKSLQQLLVINCSDLTTLPGGICSLSSLADLRIEGCSSLTSIPNGIGSLSSLTNLRIQGCSSLTSIPNGICSLSSLADLRIEGCSSLTSIPNEIGSLSSLTNLRIQGCSSLTSIPNGIRSLSSLKFVNDRPCTDIEMGLPDYILQENRQPA